MKKGETMSEEQKRKQSFTMSGRPSSFKGRQHSEESKHKIGIKSVGRKHNLGRKRPDLAFKNRLLKTGVKMSVESSRKKSVSMVGKLIGEKNPQWKGGITPINKRIRTSREYKLWR